MAGVVTSRPSALTARSVRGFMLAAFGLSWGSMIVYLLLQEQFDAVFGPMGYTNPLFVLAVYTPGIVGVFMVWRHYGTAGLGRFLRRFTRWRMATGWWLLLLLGLPAVFYAGAALAGNLDEPFPFSPWYGLFPALLPMFLIGPIEELGWRGVALPLLQQRFAPLYAGLLLGLLVALWHTPAFLLGGTKQAAWDYWPFFFGVIAVGVILTAMFNAARGSLLVAFLFHAQLNNPIWPDGQPWDMWLFVAVAAVVVLVHRRAMLDRALAATSVLEPEETPVPAGVR